MRVIFPRLPDHQRAYALVERDDGVVYRLYGGTAGPRLPHDIMHLVVERELRIADGIWGGIAAGVVLHSMRHVSGRRPPHAAERSATLLRDFRERGLRAELLGGLVESVASLDHPSAGQIRRLATAQLAVLPNPDVDPEAIASAAAALQVEAARWARLRVGEELSYDWPEARRQAPRIVRLKKRGEPVTARSRPAEVIEHGPVVLRRHRADDADALYRAVIESGDHLRRWMPWAPGYTRRTAAGYLASSDKAWEDGTAYNYAITVSAPGGTTLPALPPAAAGPCPPEVSPVEDTLVGDCGLMTRIGPGGLEIGYWVHSGYTRRGLATAAAEALVGQAFRLPGVTRVEMVIDELNVASAGVPRKLGFSPAGRRPVEPRPAAGSGMGIVWQLVRAE